MLVTVTESIGELYPSYLIGSFTFCARLHPAPELTIPVI